MLSGDPSGRFACLVDLSLVTSVDQVRTTDITDIPLQNGVLYLVTIVGMRLDAFSAASSFFPRPRAGRGPPEPPRMVGKVLTGNGITRYERGAYGLVGGEDLSDAERDQLLELCRLRLDAFREQRGEEVFAHRSRHPGSGPHRAQEPGRFGRHQQPAVSLLPLQRRQAMGGGLCVLRAGGQRPGAAGERTGAVHRRCRSGERGAQPGDPATAWG